METQVWPTWCLQLKWPVCKGSCLQPEAFCFGTWRDKRESFPRKTDLKQRGRKCVGQLSWHFECLRLPFGSALSWPSFRWQFWRKLFEMLWQRRRCKCIHLPTVSKNRCFYRMAYTMSIFLRMEIFCKFFIELFYSRSNELLLWLIQKDKLDQVISTDYIVKYLTLSV